MARSDGIPSLDRHISQAQLRDLVLAAKTEDMGPDGLDLTSVCLLPESLTAHAAIRSRQEGILAGGALLPTIVEIYDPSVTLRVLVDDGQPVGADTAVAEFDGTLHSLLAMERVALNLITHLSGIATLTDRYVAAAAKASPGSNRIYDTRKTLPLLRSLQKYAVACGGGHNQRQGLYDAILVKDNHIAHLSLAELPVAIQKACQQARADYPLCKSIEVEVDTLGQLASVLEVATGLIDIVLLDNMSLDQLRQAVAMRSRLAPAVQLEASGGVKLETVADIARTGVDRISVGQITHSAPALDLAMDIL